MRRVEAAACSFWLCTSEPATVTVTLYPGVRMANNPGAPFAASPPTELRKFGERLYLGVVTVELGGANGGAPLTPGAIYSYDVSINGRTLTDEGLLEDQTPTGLPRRFALGYVSGRLPSFVTPAPTLDGLRIAHASCRKSNGDGPDALAWLDDWTDEHFSNLDGERIQQLFLTGDQIYADDVAACLLPMLNALGIELLGREERVVVDGVSDSLVRVNATSLPALRRRKLVRDVARFSSTECDNHLIGFGEFAAMYLAAWSPHVWREIPGGEALLDQLFRPLSDGVPPALCALLTDWEGCHGGREGTSAWREARGAEVLAERERVIAWRNSVGRVARLLANVPTYMIWDDHEITDDWNLNQRWRNRVYRTALGKEIVRNGAMAYALFQAWGNDPAAFATQGPNRDFLDDTARFLATEGLDDDGRREGANVIDRLDRALGMASGAPNTQVRWHYQVPGPRHLVVVLDTRTRRKFTGQGIAPPALIDSGEQLPKSPLVDGRELLIVVSPPPVIGPFVLESLGAPLFQTVGDFLYGGEHAAIRAERLCEPGGHVTGVEGADAEGWGANEPAREELLQRLAGFRRAIVLSGDVHYVYTMTVDVWIGNDPNGARVVQLTSSPARNNFLSIVEAVLRRHALLERYQAIDVPERLAWKGKASIVLPEGAQIKPGRRARMRRAPALVPAAGWPAGTTIDEPPDWRWRARLVRDERPESQLPAWAQRPQLSPEDELVVEKPATHLRAYRAIAARHQACALGGGYRQLRQMVFATNVGVLALNGSGASLEVVHTILSRADEEGTSGERNTIHTIPLTPTPAERPELRTRG